MNKRITNERLVEINKRRLRTPTGLMPDDVTLPPLPGDSALSEELFQALLAERAHVDYLERKIGIVDDFIKLAFGENNA